MTETERLVAECRETWGERAARELAELFGLNYDELKEPEAA